MIRKIIHIDEEKCNGCGLCADACHEGAIGMVNGKAKLLRDDYCDGLGDCLPACPTGAITFVTREAKAYNEEAVKENQAQQNPSAGGCPSSQARTLTKHARQTNTVPLKNATPIAQEKQNKTEGQTSYDSTYNVDSELMQWPVQIKLVPPNAPYFEEADLLIAADCTAFSRADFHSRFMQNKVTLIGCPKLDAVDYSEKLTEILKRNEIKSITVVRMEVPCCGGIVHAVSAALKASEKKIPCEIVTISTTGSII